MARLPQPGGDDGKWGQILNDYLSQAHNDSGSLRADTVGSTQIQDQAVTGPKLAPGAVTKATVGLENVDNTSDANKPVSSATQAALNLVSAQVTTQTAPLAPVQVPVRARGTVVESAQAGHGWTSSGSIGGSTNLNDTSRAIVGDQAVTRVSDGAGGQSRLRRLGGTSRDFTGKSLRLLIYMASGRQNVGEFAVYAGSTNLSNHFRWDLTPPDYQELFVDGRVLTLTLNFADAATSGSPNRAAITDYQVVLKDNSAGTVDFSILRVDSVPDASVVFPNGVLSISMDDSFASQVDVIRYMARYDFRGTLYTIADQIDTAGCLTMANLRNAQDNLGWEIGAHAYSVANHNAYLTSLSANDLDTELRNLKNWMTKQGFAGVNHFCYPAGKMNGTVLDAVHKYFPGGSARGTYQYSLESAPAADPYQLKAASLNSGRTLASAQSRIDKAIAGKGWVHLYGHKFDGAGSIGWSLSTMQQLIDYAASSGIAVLPVGEVLRLAR